MKRIVTIVLIASAVSGSSRLAEAQANTNLPTRGSSHLAEVQTKTNLLTFDDECRAYLKSALDDKWFKRSTFVSTLLGGALAIAGGFAATWLAHNLRARHERQEKSEFSKNLLRSIRCEVEVLREIYEAGIGKRLNEVEDGKPFLFWLGLTQDWFKVFDSNAVHLGRIEGEVSRQIVTVYARARQLIEEFRINNVYLKEFNEILIHVQQHPLDGPNVAKKQQFERMMLFQANKIKEADKLLKSDTDRLFALLDQRAI